jgi:hypothetical protein
MSCLAGGPGMGVVFMKRDTIVPFEGRSNV